MKYLIKSAALLSLASMTLLSFGGSSQAVAEDVMTQVQPNDKMVAKGKKLFAQCAACHGSAGQGDGPSAAAFNPKPRNFHANKEWINPRTFAGLYQTLEKGLPGTAMSSYAHLSAADRVAIINYIRTMGDYPKVTSADLDKMEKDFEFSKAMAASANKKKPLSIDAAIAKLVKEASAETQKIQKIKSHILGSSDKGALLFKSVTVSSVKAVTTLVRSKVWGSDLSEFSKVLLAGVGHNGFDAKLGHLSKDEWQTLFAYLKTAVH